MGEESRAIEGQGNNNLRDQGGYPDRCLKEGLGSILPKQIDRRTIDIPGERSTHKCVRIEGSEIGPSDICKDPPNGQSSFSDRQYDSSILFSENGRDPKQGDGNLSQGDLGLCSIQKDHNYCGNLPGRLNTEADWASRHFQDSSEWLLSTRLFRLTCKK